MAAPKSVMKLHKQNGKTVVEYTSNCDATQYYLFELCRRALLDVARFLKRKVNEDFHAINPGKKGSVTKYIRGKVYSNKDTLYPRMVLYFTGKGGAGLNWQETGATYVDKEGKTHVTPKHGLLTKAVMNNIPQIVEIESKYLSGLSDEAERLMSMVDESEMNDEE